MQQFQFVFCGRCGSCVLIVLMLCGSLCVAWLLVADVELICRVGGVVWISRMFQRIGSLNRMLRLLFGVKYVLSYPQFDMNI